MGARRADAHTRKGEGSFNPRPAKTLGHFERENLAHGAGGSVRERAGVARRRSNGSHFSGEMSRGKINGQRVAHHLAEVGAGTWRGRERRRRRERPSRASRGTTKGLRRPLRPRSRHVSSPFSTLLVALCGAVQAPKIFTWRRPRRSTTSSVSRPTLSMRSCLIDFRVRNEVKK